MKRRLTHPVRIGTTTIGGTHSIAIQSMTNTDTNDTAACVAQIRRIYDAGAPMVRLTAQGRREAENLQHIVSSLRENGCSVGIIADIHFAPELASIAARYVDKVRINPGNYDIVKFPALIEQCRERGVAIRIGVNHGSLAQRIFDRYGDTPEGMVASAMEFLELCRDHDFDQVVVSMKSSNVRVMVAAYRLLVDTMAEAPAQASTPGCMTYPIHLGVTEAGDGLDGRIKSAVGIGVLLREGIGDTIRVSLTEDPEHEVPVGRLLAEHCAKPIPASYDDTDIETVAIKAAADLGGPLLDGQTKEIHLIAPHLTPEQIRTIEDGILQAARVKITRTEYIACPSCGRTLYDIQGTLAAIKARTSHLKIRIGVMGCIVNGPGEMADADYGYVGAAPGHITLYKGREVVERNIPQAEALDKLVELIKANGDWTPAPPQTTDPQPTN